jgi:cation diffusion facilitator CzcD-associated flavoprotein CzcO
MSLEQLEHDVARDLQRLVHGGPSWTHPPQHPEGHVHDVVVVGGGQSGLGIAFALQRERVNDVVVIDENPEGVEGPWLTYARMVTLRTPKDLTSIDLGVPSLTFRAWWEAQHGEAGWEALGKIPREQWMAYLRWYRKVLAIPVRNQTRLLAIEPDPASGVHRLRLAHGETLLARKVVLATGIQGGGDWVVPEWISQKLPASLYAHACGVIDHAALVGKRIGILGGGASAFDNAGYALQQGAGSVEVFMRRSELPRINPIRHMEAVGLIPRYAALSDADKYRLIGHFLHNAQPPTNDTFARACAQPGFQLHLGTPWLDVTEKDGKALVTTPKGRHEFDFLILSTGLLSDPALRPELAGLADRIACWRDRHQPDEADRNALLDAHPYLGAGFELLPRQPQDAPLLRGLFAFNYGALINHGVSASALSGLKYALPKLACAVADQLFVDERDAAVEAFFGYDTAEFTGQWPQPEQAAA